jgi:hypothetical protein
MFAVLNFVFAAIIGQIPHLITGIPGIGYAFTIFYSITIAVAILFYEGRRWRFFIQGLLFALLSSFLGISMIALVSKISLVLNAFILDVIFNSFYQSFKRKKKLVWLSILGQVYYWITDSFWLLLISLLVFPWEGVIASWSLIMPFMLPIMTIEAVVGGYIGYKIYLRVKKVQN